jgi:hypothetical protein
MPHAAVVRFPGIEPLGRFTEHSFLFRIYDGGRYGRRDCARDFILDGENIRQIAVVS